MYKYNKYYTGGTLLKVPRTKCNICNEGFNDRAKNPVCLHRGSPIAISKSTLNNSDAHFVCQECYNKQSFNKHICPDCGISLDNEIIIFDYDELSGILMNWYRSLYETAQYYKSISNDYTVRLLTEISNDTGKDNKYARRSMIELGNYYYESKNYKQSFHWYENCLQIYDDLDAMYMVSKCYYSGKGVLQDREKGIKILKDLAQIYQEGKESIDPRNIKMAISLYEILSKKNDSDSEYKLGEIYFKGIPEIDEDDGILPDKIDACSWFIKAAMNDSNDALLDIGICYDHGAYVNIPYESTIKKLESQGVSKKNNMFQKLKDIKHLNTCEMYNNFNSHNNSINYRKAFTLYNIVLKQPNIDKSVKNRALMLLGISYFYGRGIPKNTNMAIHLLTPPALDKSVKSQLTLAEIYESENDYVNCVKWYKIAGDNGSPRALYKIGMFYKNGYGDVIVKNLDNSIISLKKATEINLTNSSPNEGRLKASFQLGVIYKEMKDYTKSFDWFYKSSKFGNIDAKIEYAKCLYYGIGTDVNLNKSLTRFNDIITESPQNEEALFYLAELYFHGNPNSKSLDFKDHGKAFLYYHRLGLRNYVNAYYPLALCYEQGYGTIKNLRDAVLWYREASRQGDKKATERLKELPKFSFSGSL